MLADSVITSKGQTTVPKEVRDVLHLDSGARLVWLKQSDTEFLVTRSTSARSLKGMFKSPLERPVTIDEMNTAIAEAASAGVKK